MSYNNYFVVPFGINCYLYVRLLLSLRVVFIPSLNKVLMWGSLELLERERYYLHSSSTHPENVGDIGFLI